MKNIIPDNYIKIPIKMINLSLFPIKKGKSAMNTQKNISHSKKKSPKQNSKFMTVINKDTDTSTTLNSNNTSTLSTNRLHLNRSASMILPNIYPQYENRKSVKNIKIIKVGKKLKYSKRKSDYHHYINNAMKSKAESTNNRRDIASYKKKREICLDDLTIEHIDVKKPLSIFKNLQIKHSVIYNKVHKGISCCL